MPHHHIILSAHKPVRRNFMPVQTGDGTDIPLGGIDGSQFQSHIGVHTADIGSAGPQGIVIIGPGSLDPEF